MARTWVNPVTGTMGQGPGYRSPGSTNGVGSTNHQGYDIRAPEGTQVVAATGGTVTRAEYSSSYGNVVYVTQPDGSQQRYAHLSSLDVSKGDTVNTGDNIGEVGSTGHATGPHLHYENRGPDGSITGNATGDDSLNQQYAQKGNKIQGGQKGDGTGTDASNDKNSGKQGDGKGDPSKKSDHEQTAKENSPLKPKDHDDIKGTAGNFQKVQTKSIVSRMPTHEPWSGHPKSTVGPRQALEGSDGGGGSGGGGGGGGGGSGGSSGSSANPSGGKATTDANAKGSQTKSITPEGRALLDTIAEAEGTYGKGNDGYNINFGGRTFDGNQFPNRPRQFAVNGSTTSAAGRYQFEYGTWNTYKNRLGLPDFSPESQDKAAWADAQDVYRRKGGGDLQTALENGTFDPNKLGSEWASFPGTTGQTRRSASQIQSNYQKFLQKQKGQKPPTADPGPKGNPSDAPSPSPGASVPSSGSSTAPSAAAQKPTPTS